MSEWITHQLPTSSESDEHGCVWFTGSTGSVYRRHHTNFDLGEPWMAIPKGKPPEPYVPPEPKHREVTADLSDSSDNWLRIVPDGEVVKGSQKTVVRMREVLPGDAHPDTVATIADEMIGVANLGSPVRSEAVRNWAKMLKRGQ